MKLYRVMRTALIALRRNPLRALLTTLGIVIGVGAVIAMMEIGAGSAAAIRNSIATMGANVLLVLPGTAASGGISFGSGTVMTMTPDDCEAILRDATAVRGAAPIVRARTQVIYGNRNWVPNSMFGTTMAFLEIRDWAAGRGRVLHRTRHPATRIASASSGRPSSGSCSRASPPSARRCACRTCPSAWSGSSPPRAPT